MLSTPDSLAFYQRVSSLVDELELAEVSIDALEPFGLSNATDNDSAEAPPIYRTPGWLGPVERRNPDDVRQRSVQLTWMCPHPYCRRFTMNGAYRVGRCNWCGTPRAGDTHTDILALITPQPHHW